MIKDQRKRLSVPLSRTSVEFAFWIITTKRQAMFLAPLIIEATYCSGASTFCTVLEYLAYGEFTLGHLPFNSQPLLTPFQLARMRYLLQRELGLAAQLHAARL